MNIYRELIRREDIQEYYKKGDEILSTLGYTDHSTAHASIVASKAAEVLSWFHYPDHLLGLARAAGYLHDIGNAINRTHHGEYGALLANDILKEMDVSCADRAAIVSAIANHDESTGAAFDPVSAALIIADKTDLRRNRVRKKPVSQFDIHDRVNYAVTRSLTSYKPEKSSILSATVRSA